MYDLDELAGLAVSDLHRWLGGAAAVVLGTGAFGLCVWLQPPQKVFAAVVIGACGLGYWLARRIRRAPERFPSIRVLQERARDVRFIVSVHRSRHYLILLDHERRFLAAPLKLNDVIALNIFTETASARADAASARQAERAIEIAAKRCPDATIARTVDRIGVIPLSFLARRALEELSSDLNARPVRPGSPARRG
jgi:hypothetical protein